MLMMSPLTVEGKPLEVAKRSTGYARFLLKLTESMLAVFQAARLG